MTSVLQVITTVTMIGFLMWNCAVAASAAAAGTGSYRIRSRPPAGTTHQSRSSSTGMSRSSSGGGSNWQDVYIAGFLALSDHEIEAPLGQGVMPAITLALRHLANSSFLHEYRLRLLYNDTQFSLVFFRFLAFSRVFSRFLASFDDDDDEDDTDGKRCLCHPRGCSITQNELSKKKSSQHNNEKNISNERRG
ncbi:hypothetical protein OUZ56_008557 [Daphnia magna]|nr:hypothetical protein OUZ56_008557 [Daphnia magna]